MSIELIIIMLLAIALFGLPFWAKLYERFRGSDKQRSISEDNPPEKPAPTRKPSGPDRVDKAA